MKAKVIKLTALGLLSLFCLGGCATMTELSNEDMDRVVVYSAGVISRFNKYQNRGIIPVDMTKEVIDPFADPVPEEMENKEDTQATGQGASGTVDGQESGEVANPLDGSVEGNPPVSSGEASSLTDVIGIPGATFTYKTVMVNNNYGNNEFFVYEPTPGNSFVTAVFTVKNDTGAPLNVNLKDMSLSFTSSVGGQTAVVYRTAFGDDLTTYNGNLAPGESKDLTVLFQFPESTAANLDGFALTVIRDGVKHPVTL